MLAGIVCSSFSYPGASSFNITLALGSCGQPGADGAVPWLDFLIYAAFALDAPGEVSPEPCALHPESLHPKPKSSCAVVDNLEPMEQYKFAVILTNSAGASHRSRSILTLFPTHRPTGPTTRGDSRTVGHEVGRNVAIFDDLSVFVPR
jgi:hypothetical protein